MLAFKTIPFPMEHACTREKQKTNKKPWLFKEEENFCELNCKSQSVFRKISVSFMKAKFSFSMASIIHVCFRRTGR